MKKILPILAALALVLALASVLVPGLARPRRYERTIYDCFDTVTTLTACADNQAQFDRYADAVHDELLRLHRLFDIYHTYDGLVNLKTLNDQAGGPALEVDQDIVDLLSYGVEAHGLSGGAVNIALGSVTALWREHRSEGTGLPDSEALARAGQHCDVSRIIIDSQAGTVRLADPHMRLDVGALAKGWAAGRAMALAESEGMSSAVLSAGGNVIALGTPADKPGSRWRVGVQNPRWDGQGDDSLLTVLELENLAAVTSGDYERYYTVDGVRYHHIIDPATLMPAGRFHSVTVVAGDSGVADMLSTALFILPLEEGMALAKALGAEALWVELDGGVRSTDHFPATL